MKVFTLISQLEREFIFTKRSKINYKTYPTKIYMHSNFYFRSLSSIEQYFIELKYVQELD